TTTTPYASFLYNTVGNFRVRLISEDLNSCNLRDTSYKFISVRNNAVTNLDFNFAAVGNCADRIFQFTNLSVPPPGGSFGPASFIWDFGDGSKPDTVGFAPFNHTFPAEGTYRVRMTLVDPQFCNENDFVEKNIRIALALQPAFLSDTACLGSPTQFTYTGKGGATYSWDFGDGSPLSTAENPEHTYTTAGNFTVTLTVTDPNVCDPIKTRTIAGLVLVSPIPISALDYTPKNSAPNSLYTFTNLSTGATNYQWDFGDGSRLNTLRRDTLVQHTYPATGTYEACLFAINGAGCIAKTCVNIDAVVNPLFDVPNAFTPNGDGVNDKIFVRGFGIAKMSWKIYNRWGQLVFFSTDPAQGWDGRFQGKIQPQEVYHYTVEIEFSDKVKQVRKGDITLLR
ncbi:MAG: PKD domain-containing protein, partial [Sphingobacteriia bacterium]